MDVLVVGAGYAGLVTAACFANGGHTVYVYDRIKEKADRIGQGESPFFEKGLGPILRQSVHDKRLVPVDLDEGFKRSEIILICVGTPPSEDGSIDLRQLNEAAKALGAELKKADSRKLFVLRSTVVPGTTAAFAERLSSISGKKFPRDFGVASNPEFLRQGQAIEDFMHRNPVIIGADDDRDLAALADLYRPFGRPIRTMSLKSAEMAKYLNNCLSATKISFINELGALSKTLGVDINELIDVLDIRVGVGQDTLKAGCGFGGSCLDKDSRALLAVAKASGVRLEMLEKALEVNDRMPGEVVKILERRLGGLDNRRIGILGLAFKAGTDDLRNSRSVAVIEELGKRNCSVSAFDPKSVVPPGITVSRDPQDLIDGSDAVVIMTDWDEFAALDYRDKAVVDAKGIIPRIKRGRNYEGICWP